MRSPCRAIDTSHDVGRTCAASHRPSAYLLGPYLREQRLGEVIISPADVMFGPRTMVEPDLFAIPLTPGPLPRAWEEVGRLLFTVEVLSPSTLRTDRSDKRELYQRKGVRVLDHRRSMASGWSGGALTMRRPKR